MSTPAESVRSANRSPRGTADDGLALAAAVQLREHRVASLALHPGLVRTEGVMQFAEHLDLTRSQSPEGVGRAVAALTPTSWT